MRPRYPRLPALARKRCSGIGRFYHAECVIEASTRLGLELAAAALAGRASFYGAEMEV